MRSRGRVWRNSVTASPVTFVFACITAAHLVQNATLPDIQSEISAWRKHMAARIATIRIEPEAEPEPAQPQQSLDEVGKAEADDDFEDDFE